MKNHVIIVAGGAGTRMRSVVPKQFLCLGGTPILMRSISIFREFDKDINIVLVLPKDQFTEWQKLCDKYSFSEQLLIVEGGDTRFQSVKNGLGQIMDSKGLIAVHDAVRPFVTKEIIERVFRTAGKNGNAVPFVHPNDSIRISFNDTSKPYQRKDVFIIQTPQCFQSNLLKKAYQQEYNERYTDDATAVENIGEKIYLIEGSKENIKITTPEDLIIAEAMLRSNTKQ